MGIGALLGVSATTALLVWLVLGSGNRGAGATEIAALRRDVEALAREVAALRAEHRTIASLHAMSDRGERTTPRSSTDASVGPTAPSRGGGTLAAKPLEGMEQDAGERARRIGDHEIARALERATAIPSIDVVASEAPALPPPPAVDAAASPAPDTPSDPDAAKRSAAEAEAADAELAKKADQEAVIAAFNRLLADAGIEGWTLLTAEVRDQEHALGKVVLAQRSPQGTAIGSLTAEQLTLERDPITGVAGILLTGARGMEAGVEIAFQNGTTRVDIPGILPLDLLAPRLRDLLGVQPGDEKEQAFASADQIVEAINRVLAKEAGVGMRVRSVNEVADRTLKKAVIDLAFDERGAATQTVLADEAWFELNLAGRYGELCCEGGEMLEKGQKRPLFRGRLRVPLREISPAQWRGVPAARLTEGS